MHSPDLDSISPAGLQWRADGGIEVSFSDGHRAVLSRAWLRAMCPCATCQGTHGPPTTLVDARPIATPTPPAAPAPAAEPAPEPGAAKPKPKFAISAGKRPATVDEALRLLRADPVGAYGMKLTWGDGHDTGIYTWRYLRACSPGDGTDAHPPTPAALAARPRALEAMGR